MAIPNERLKQIYTELHDRFDKNPYITITPLDEEPSEKYTVHYNLTGLTLDSNGRVEETKKHSILINIPFGFPHFPPSCTPQTPIFHPDFDQAAICIGEFWHKDKTLSELIIHIGKMILGEQYSTDNAFNDEALKWYIENTAQLPFEDIELSPEKITEESIPEIPDDELSLAIDTLDDDDIISSTGSFESGKKPQEDDIAFPSTAQPTGKSSINRVHLLIRQKRYYELSLFLEDIPKNSHFEDRQEIEDQVSSYVNKANELYSEGLNSEDLGEPHRALDLFLEVADIVPDFPEIQDCIDRARRSVDFSDEPIPEGSEVEASVVTPPEETTETEQGGVKFFEDEVEDSVKTAPFIGAGIAVLICCVIGYFYFSAGSKFKKAEAAYKQCQNYLDSNKFNQTQQSCDKSIGLLETVLLFKQDDKNRLRQQIEKLLVSRKLEEGLSGRILYKGKYVDINAVSLLKTFYLLVAEADDNFNKQSWSKAVELYDKAMDIGKTVITNIDENTILKIEDNTLIAKVNDLTDKGSAFQTSGELNIAKETYLSIASSLKKVSGETAKNLLVNVELKIREVDYLLHLNLGEKYFISNDWEAAIEQYEKALQLKDQKNISTEEEALLYKNMAEAELYSIISDAKNSLAQAQWEKAISEYRKAIGMLSQKEDLLSQINPVEIGARLERIVLRTQIVLNKNSADNHVDNGEYREAIIIYEQIISNIQEADLEEDKEFKPILTGTHDAIVEVQEKMVLADKIDYLTTNYKQIFQANYPAAIPENLSSPKASYKRDIGNKQLFELQCLERNRNRQLRLVMLYLYDPATKSWSFYSEAGAVN